MEPGEGQGATSGHASWTTAQSSFMLSHLANVVASGTRTSSGFKKVHLNSCAKAINEKFNTMFSADQVRNHLKTWSRKFQKINKLRKLSAAGWDEINFIITVDDENYNEYVATHKADAEYLNKPIEHYAEMQTIFGNSMATGHFSKDSNSALGTHDVDAEEQDLNENGVTDATTSHGDNGASSSASKPKKAKISAVEEDGLLSAFNRVGDNIAKAIEKVAAAPTSNDLPDDLFDMLSSLPGFEETHISFYFAHLVANPHIGRAFYKLPFNHKLMWVSMFVAEKFPGQ